jgi:invasion protein IalB
MVIEQPGRPEKFLRITLPHHLMIAQGTRVMVDSGDPMNGSYVSCTATGCVTDYTVSDEMIGRMRNGRYLIVQAMHVRGKPVTWMVPIADFGKAYDGPPADLAKFKSIYESPPRPWLDDTLQPHLRPKY